MKHPHSPISREQARSLSSCRALALEFCACGAFRLNGSERWVSPHGPPQEEFTAAEVASRLHCCRDTVYRLCARKELRGIKRRGPYSTPRRKTCALKLDAPASLG